MELTPKRPSIEDAFPLAHRETSVDGEAERLFTPGQLETGLQELDCDFDLDLDEPFGHCVTPEVPLVPQFPSECIDTLAHHETSVDGEVERLFTPGQLETGLQGLDCDFNLDLDKIFGRCVTPEFPLAPQFPSECIDPALMMKSPDLAQSPIPDFLLSSQPQSKFIDPALIMKSLDLVHSPINKTHTDLPLANTHQTPHLISQPRHFYHDPSQSIQASVGPYFNKAAPSYEAQYERRQEPLLYVNAHLQHGAPFNQRYPSQNIPPSQPEFIRPGFNTGTPLDTSKIRGSSLGIICNDYRPLGKVPESWDCFGYDEYGALKPGSTYSVEEIHRYLFSNPQHSTSGVYNPKLSGLTLWIQRTPHLDDCSHSDSSACECRFKCCKKAGKISTGELRVAFDEHTRNSLNHNPQQNAGYVHLRCLERFLDFPRICIELNVKSEDRIFSDGRPKKSCMILRTMGEADIVDRFVNFCSTNRRGPTSYPAMNMRTHTRSFQGTLEQEAESLSQPPYRKHMQKIWETKGRNGVTAEFELEKERKLQKYGLGKYAKAVAQVREPVIQTQSAVTSQRRPERLPKKQATKKLAKKVKNRAPEPESESESESTSDSAQENYVWIKRRKRTQARIEKPVQRERGRKYVRTRKAELKSQSIPSKHRSKKQAQKHKPRPRAESTSSTSSSDRSFERHKRSRKRAREAEPAPGSETSPSSDCSSEYQSRARRRAKKHDSRRPVRTQCQEVNDEECELPRPAKRARRT